MENLNLALFKQKLLKEFVIVKESYLDSKLRILSTDYFEKPIPVIEVFDDIRKEWNPIATLGNISIIKGKAKSKKSTLLSLIVSAGVLNQELQSKIRCNLPEHKRNILYLDTEQQKHHVGLALHRVDVLTNSTEVDNLLFMYCLRALSPKERLSKLKEYIESIPNLGIVVIDGIRDLMMSINDEVESTELVSVLMKWSLELDVHIITVLHENPTSDKARGHIGTEMMNKSETVIKVEVDKSDESISVVIPDMCRNKSFKPFAIEIDDFGIPKISDQEVSFNQKKKVMMKDLAYDQKCKLIEVVFSDNKERSYGTLIEDIGAYFKSTYGNDIGRNQIVEFIKMAKEDKLISQEAQNKPYVQTIIKF
jgi:hypothetical protein